MFSFLMKRKEGQSNRIHSYLIVKLFADDVKLYIRVINSVDYDRIQAALSALYAWAEDWQLSISISKCCVLHVGKGSVTTSTTTPAHHFFINGSPLPVVNSCRDDLQ